MANKNGLGSVINKTADKCKNAILKSFTATKPNFLSSLQNISFTDVASILIAYNQQAI